MSPGNLLNTAHYV